MQERICRPQDALQSYFCLLFGARQKVRRLPGRNPAVLILIVIGRVSVATGENETPPQPLLRTNPNINAGDTEGKVVMAHLAEPCLNHHLFELLLCGELSH